jgi:excisionase family DNA binding protein
VTDLAQLILEELASDPAALDRLRDLLGLDGGGAEPWVGVVQAAAHLGAGRQRIYDLVHQRAIPFRKDGSRLLFRLSELDAWLAQR